MALTLIAWFAAAALGVTAVGGGLVAYTLQQPEATPPAATISAFELSDDDIAPVVEAAPEVITPSATPTLIAPVATLPEISVSPSEILVTDAPATAESDDDLDEFYDDSDVAEDEGDDSEIQDARGDDSDESTDSSDLDDESDDVDDDESDDVDLDESDDVDDDESEDGDDD